MIPRKEQVNIKELALQEPSMRARRIFDPEKDIDKEFRSALFNELGNIQNISPYIKSAGALAFVFPSMKVTDERKEEIEKFIQKKTEEYKNFGIVPEFMLEYFLFAKKLVPTIEMDEDMYQVTKNSLLSNPEPNTRVDTMYWAQFVIPGIRDEFPIRREDKVVIEERLNKFRYDPDSRMLSTNVAAMTKTLAPSLLEENTFTDEELGRMIDDMKNSRYATSYHHLFNLYVLSANQIIFHPDGPEFIMPGDELKLQSQNPMPDIRRF